MELWIEKLLSRGRENHNKKMMVGSMKLIYLHKRVKLVEATEFWMGNISSDSVYTAIL